MTENLHFSFPKKDSLEVMVRSATEVPYLYKSRIFWETYFRDIGLWPEMIGGDAASDLYSSGIDKKFLEFQCVATIKGTDSVAGISHAVPLHITSIEDLPENGWDWAVAKAFTDASSDTIPNSLCGLSISVLPDFQCCGVGRKLAENLTRLANKHDLKYVIIPIRPVLKERFPLVPMAEFINYLQDDNFHEDFWIRTHQKLGGKIQKICNNSMNVSAPLEQWEKWCKREFPESGEYIIDRGLAPVTIDIEKKIGSYTEPNVWMVYDLSTLWQGRTRARPSSGRQMG